MTTDIATSRRSFIGSSDVAKIIGVSTYGDAYSLYLEKTGEIERPDIETKVQRRGKILETPIAHLYVDDTGADVPASTPRCRRASISAPRWTARKRLATS
jgi:predicted phage-related endonuclease